MSEEIRRLEAKLDSIASDMSNVRETLAGVVARAEAAVTTAAALEIVRRDLAEHEQEDASLQAELQADVKRLWWGVGAVFVPALVSLWIALLNGRWST